MRRSGILLAATLTAAILVAGCDDASESDEVAAAPEAQVDPSAALPAARWDHRPEAGRWTRAVLEALDGPGRELVIMVPVDIAAWCPSYDDAPPRQRKAFWVGLLSALAKHESTWRPDVSGGDGRWHGLLQISPATARGYGCVADTGEELRVGAANLRCAIRIMGVTVPRDGVVAANGGGVAADWGPFHQQAKRSEMREWVSEQPYCRG